MKVLAIDPGYDRMGIAVLEGDPSRPSYVWSACVEPAKGTSEERLATIARAVEKAIKKHAPNILALEKLFFSTNKKTAIKVGEARGVVLAIAGLHELPVTEFSPQAVKLAVTGYGNADKHAISRMIPHLISLPKAKRRDDELDAIALGIAALAAKKKFA